jgi:CRP-like cAMP-binding protein
MSIASIAERLNEFSVFGGIEAAALLELGDLFETQTYAMGAHLIDEGEQGNRLYVITEGKVEVSIRLDPSKRQGGGEANLPLATLRAGDTFGEMELIDTQRRSATVIALVQTETLELTNMGLFAVFQRDPDAFRMIMMNLARDLSRRLRAADRRLAALAESGVLPEQE